MPELIYRNLVGQSRVKGVTSSAFSSGQLGHAYLFTGPMGSGKFAAALELAMAILCESETVPCGTCDSCRMVLSNTHPDFRCVFPVVLEAKHKRNDGKELSEEGWELIRTHLKQRIDEPYTIFETPQSTGIPVDWMRELNAAIMRGPVRGKRSASIICDIDQLNNNSSNAMLKTLEEPPEGATIILLSGRPNDVLPTIRSRCQILRFGLVPVNEIAVFLAKRKDALPTDPEIIAAASGSDGLPGIAVRLADGEPDEVASLASQFVGLCAEKTPVLRAMETIERIDEAAREPGFLERFFTSCARIARENAISAAQSRPLRGASIGFAGSDTVRLSKYFAVCEDGVEKARARVMPHLALINTYMKLSGLIHDTE